jgi:hypothetical protein
MFQVPSIAGSAGAGMSGSATSEAARFFGVPPSTSMKLGQKPLRQE